MGWRTSVQRQRLFFSRCRLPSGLSTIANTSYQKIQIQVPDSSGFFSHLCGAHSFVGSWRIICGFITWGLRCSIDIFGCVDLLSITWRNGKSIDVICCHFYSLWVMSITFTEQPRTKKLAIIFCCLQSTYIVAKPVAYVLYRRHWSSKRLTLTSTRPYHVSPVLSPDL